MHAFTYLVFSLVGAAHGLPAFLTEAKRSWINISPVIKLGIDLKNDNTCLGVGVSVCDPITVNSKTNSTAVDTVSSSKSPKPTKTKPKDKDDDALIVVSPTITSDLKVSNENNCLGIGISACDPITVGSNTAKTVTNSDDSSSDEKTETTETTENETEQSSYPTASNEIKSTPTTVTSASESDSSSGGSLLDLSPVVSPDINLKNENSCQGIGISACDPITVNSTTTQNAS